MDEGSTLPLQVWLSPAFPVGGFAYSHGLEWVIEAGDIGGAGDLAAWIDDLLDHGSLRADAVLLSLAWRARDGIEGAATNALALALAPSAERWLETSAQGTAFLATVTAAWPAPGIARFAEAIGSGESAYPVAVGVAAAAHAVPLLATLEAFVLATVGNLVSAVVRSGPIGQSEAQSIIAGRVPAARRLAAFATTATQDELGTCAWRSDIASMRHETQYSRLFRS